MTLYSDRTRTRLAGLRLTIGLSAAVVTAVMLLLPGHARVAAAGRTLYVAPNGSPGNDGSLARPFDLATAISSAGPARPGDTIWVRGGTYSGVFTSTLTGTAAAPITLRAYPDERATIDGGVSPASPTFVVLGAWAVYWGLEITNSGPNRLVDISGRGTALDIYGPNTKFINMVVHDGQTGIGFWTPATNSEIYGSIVYNNGIDWSDRGHGHSIYTQNQSGIKRIVDNVLLNSFSFGIHAYTQSGAIDNFVMDGNVSFNNGVLSAVSGAKSELLLGGGQVAHNAVITNNVFYGTSGFGGRGAEIGYGVPCANATVQGNYFVEDTTLNLNCSGTTLSGNTLFGGIAPQLPPAYPNNTYLSARPAAPRVIVRPNQYEAGRANIVVLNWPRQAQVGVDLAAANIAIGDGFEIRDAQNYYGAPVAAGQYAGGLVMLPMTGLTVAAPIGNAPLRAAHTTADFGAFIVTRRGSAPSSGVTATFAASPASITAGQSSSLSWSTSNAASVNISPGIGAVSTSGSLTVSPTSTTTYTLTAAGAQGISTTQTAVVTVTAPPTPGTATFVRVDSTTKGSWHSVYGADGSAQPIGGTQLPAYATTAFAGQASWKWTASTTDVRALQVLSGTTRTASTWYAASAFSLDLNLTDGAAHQVGFYVLDWDRLGRQQRIDVFDAASGALLNSQTVSDSTGGQYWIWRLSGSVRVTFTPLAGNAVLAGLFFDPVNTSSPTPLPPTATMSATPASIVAGQSTTLAWSSTNGVSASIDQGIGPVALNGSLSVTPAAGKTYTVTITAANGTTVSASAVVAVTTGTVTPPVVGGASAAFLRADSTTKGSWHGVYGADGSAQPSGGTQRPAYATTAFAGQASWQWAGATTDTRALQLLSGNTRAASTWYAASAFSLDLNLTDGAAHQVGFYVLDWDRLGRQQRIDVFDAASGALLNTQTVSDSTGGQYLIWRLSGRVRVTFTGLVGNAVLGGLFFDPVTSSPTPPTPPVAGAASAAFVRTDSTTKGIWHGVYGGDGSAQPYAGTQLPAYATAAFAGQGSWQWTSSTTDPRALQFLNSTAQAASTWYAPSVFSLDLNLIDGATHQVGFYVLDFDRVGRRQTIDVFDAASGALLDTQTVSDSTGGQYFIWRLSGRVRVTFTRVAGDAVLAGLFFDR